jgi:CSLREA domain-containing protein
MQRPNPAPLLLPLILLAACTEHQPPSAPPEPGGPAFDHTPGHTVVNSVADPGDGICNAAQCTLREAIDHPGSEISFAPGLSGPITLEPVPAVGGGPLIITKKLSITGPSQRIVIQRRSTDPAFRIVEILNAFGPVTLTNLVIRGGKTSGSDRGSPGSGGGIILLDDDVVRLTNCVVADNSATFGGGILGFGRLTLTHSRISGNSARFGGGGINNAGDGVLTLTNSTVSGNSTTEGEGGGISSNGVLTLTNSTISGNRAALNGGGISGSRLTLSNSTVSGNTAIRDGGGIAGGGTLTNSTISGNSARSGGGVAGTLTLASTTVARNSATRDGGGISTAGSLELTNTLVALNAAPRGPDVHGKSGSTIMAFFSLLGIGSGSGLSNGVNGNQVGRQHAPLDPKLGPLAGNGGPTLTRALQPGSPAIDAASTPDCPATDQRGVLRPQGPVCDIGSYERK